MTRTPTATMFSACLSSRLRSHNGRFSANMCFPHASFSQISYLNSSRKDISSTPTANIFSKMSGNHFQDDEVRNCENERGPGFVHAKPYPWPHDVPMDMKTTALVIIDMQNDFCSPGGYLEAQGLSIASARAILPRIQALLHAFRAHNYPVYHTREGHRADLSTLSSRELQRSRNNPTGLGIGDQGPMGRLLVRGEPGHDIIPELMPLPTEPIIDKPGRSAFQHTDFKLLLDLKGVKNLVLCGVTTDVCVTTTMRDANDLGMDCLLVSDACAAGDQVLHDAACAMVREEGGIFGATATTDEVLTGLGAGLKGYKYPNNSIVNDQQ